jgi:hypothetical protein
MTAEMALGHVGLVLGLEISRLARNNTDWYRLLDLRGVTDTLIGGGDGIYHPSLFNDPGTAADLPHLPRYVTNQAKRDSLGLAWDACMLLRLSLGFKYFVRRVG